MARTPHGWRARVRSLAMVMTVALATACGSTVQQGVGAQNVAAPGLASEVAGSGEDFGLEPSTPGASDDAAVGLDSSGGQVAGGAIVAGGGQSSAPGAAGGGSAPGGSSTGGGTAGGGGGTGGGGGGGTGGGGGGTGGGGGGTGGGGGGTGGGGGGTGGGGAMPPEGRGYDENTLYIGFAMTQDARESGKSAGFDVYTGDTRRQAEAVKNDINSRGGILGRKIELIYHDISSADFASNRAAAQEAACRTWTEDNTVFAAVSGTGNLQYGESPVYQCLAKRDTALFFSDNAAHEGSLYRQYPSHVFTPGVASVDRYGPALVGALVDQRYFSKWDTSAGAPGVMPAKVGVLYTTDQPSVPRVYGPPLRRAGFPNPEYFEASAESTQAFAADLAAAVLRFRREGVTHVITNGTLPYFGPAAENQGYRPRYGVSTWDALSLATQTVPARALNGAVGAGYLPHVDVDAGNAPRDEKSNPVVARCLNIMKKSGQVATNRFTVYSMVTKCEMFWLLERALTRAGRFDTATMRAAIDTFQKPVVGGVTFVHRYSPPAQHDGAAAVRSVAYKSGRGFVYTSGNRLIDR